MDFDIITSNKEGLMPTVLKKTMIGALALLMVTIVGCGGSSGHGGFSSYALRPMPLDSGTLTVGFNQGFAVEVTATEDLTVDALVIDILASPAVDIAGVEIRDETSNTLPNSILRFPFIPVYPLRVQIPVNEFIPAGRRKVFVVFADVIRVQRANNMQMVLLDLRGTNSGGGQLPQLGAPILGPTKSSNP